MREDLPVVNVTFSLRKEFAGKEISPAKIKWALFNVPCLDSNFVRFALRKAVLEKQYDSSSNSWVDKSFEHYDGYLQLKKPQKLSKLSKALFDATFESEMSDRELAIKGKGCYFTWIYSGVSCKPIKDSNGKFIKPFSFGKFKEEEPDLLWDELENCKKCFICDSCNKDSYDCEDCELLHLNFKLDIEEGIDEDRLDKLKQQSDFIQCFEEGYCNGLPCEKHANAYNFPASYYEKRSSNISR